MGNCKSVLRRVYRRVYRCVYTLGCTGIKPGVGHARVRHSRVDTGEVGMGSEESEKWM